MDYEAWTCRGCGRSKPIPQLARDCEQRHATAYDVSVEELVALVTSGDLQRPLKDEPVRSRLKSH